MIMELFYRRHKKKVQGTLVLMALGIIALVVHKVLVNQYTQVSIQADISFWIATVLLLATIAMGIFLMILEYVQIQKK